MLDIAPVEGRQQIEEFIRLPGRAAVLLAGSAPR
jgi:hypothetical protein